MKMGLVNCCVCGKEYSRPLGRINEANRNGWKPFCSSTCQRNHRYKSKTVACFNCKKDVVVTPAEQKRSKQGKFFCSHHCAAIDRNTGRKRTEKEKKAASDSLTRYYDRVGRKIRTRKSAPIKIKKVKIVIKNTELLVSCPICGKSCKPNRKACSRKCGFVLKLGYSVSKEELDVLFIELKKQTNLSPSSKMVAGKYRSAANKYYGSWNKAMAHFGFELNTQWMIKRNIPCKDGHIANSISEMMVDNWLYENGIEHDRYKVYPNSKCNCDFYLPKTNQWVEYFGLSGQHKAYDKRVKEKIELARVNGLNLVGLYAEDIYPTINIKAKLGL